MLQNQQLLEDMEAAKNRTGDDDEEKKDAAQRSLFGLGQNRTDR